MFPAFYLQNLHFAISIFTAMVMSWCFWLYIDVWSARKNFRGMLMWLGFLLLTASFLVNAFELETSVFVGNLENQELYEVISLLTRIFAYLFICIGIFLEPVLANPIKQKLTTKTDGKVNTAFISGGMPLSVLGVFSLPIFAAITGLLFLYKATIGLEFHLRKVAVAFFGISLFELLSLRQLFEDSSNIAIFKLVAPFSPLWIIQYLVLLISSLLLGSWVFGYLVKRLSTQLYIFFSVSILFIFIVSTISFTRLLLGNIQTEALNQLRSSVGVLKFALDAKKDTLASDTEVFAKSQDIARYIKEDENTQLAKLASGYLLTKKLSSLVVISDKGQVLARGEEPERIGDSFSENPLFKVALRGKSASSVTTRDGVLAPDVLMVAAAPVLSENEIVGVILSQQVVDNTFVDAVNTATGLNSSVYGGDKISATTLMAEDGVTKRIGIAESNKDVLNDVLAKGDYYLGSVDFLNTPYFSAYIPLKDMDEVPIGMLFAGKPQVTVLATAGRSIQASFVVAGILWFLAILPSFLIAGYISKQLR